MRTKWLSPQIEEIRGRKVFYACRIVSGECVSTGDYVHLLPSELVPADDPTSITTRAELYIARIESMYEDAENASKWIQVRWFYRPSDLQHDPPSQPLQNEVYHTQYYDCHVVESIVGRCNVMWRENYLRLLISSRLSTRNNAGVLQHDISNKQVVYTCGYSYCIATADASVIINGNFSTVQEEDLAGHVAGLPYLDIHGIGERKYCNSHECAVITRYLANRLLSIERYIPQDVTRAEWYMAKRLPWVLKAKNAMTLEDLKYLLIEMERGLQVFKDQIKWRTKVNSIASFSQLNNHIRYLKHNIQRKVDNAFMKYRKLKTPPANHKESNEQIVRKKRKHFAMGMITTEKASLKRQQIGGVVVKISVGNVYEIEHKQLPPSAPRGLRYLRVAMVSQSSKEKVTITYPRISSLNMKHFKYLQYNSVIPDYNNAPDQKRWGNAMYNYSLKRSRPVIHLDGCFVMLHNVAEKVLKRQISRSEYLDLHHLQSFWLMCPNEGSCREGNENQLKHITDGDNIFLKKPPSVNPESLQKDQMQTLPDQQNTIIITNSETGTGSPQLFRRKLKKSNSTIEHEYGDEDSPNKDVQRGKSENYHFFETLDGYRFPIRWGTRKRIVYQSPQANADLTIEDPGHTKPTYSDEHNIEQTKHPELKPGLIEYSLMILLDSEGGERPNLISAVQKDKVICHHLKEYILDLKCQLQSLSLQITASHESIDFEFSPTSKTFEESTRKQSEMTDEIEARKNPELIGTSRNFDCTWHHLMEAIQKRIIQFLKDATERYRKFSNENINTREQLDELRTFNGKVQEELCAILRSLELFQNIHGGLEMSEIICIGNKKESEVSSQSCKSTVTMKTKVENVRLFQIASGIGASSSTSDLWGSSENSSSVATHSGIPSLSFSRKHRIFSRKEDHVSSGFRVWIPESSGAEIKLSPLKTGTSTKAMGIKTISYTLTEADYITPSKEEAGRLYAQSNIYTDTLLNPCNIGERMRIC